MSEKDLIASLTNYKNGTQETLSALKGSLLKLKARDVTDPTLPLSDKRKKFSGNTGKKSPIKKCISVSWNPYLVQAPQRCELMSPA